jgi:hypothetical protein
MVDVPCSVKNPLCALGPQFSFLGSFVEIGDFDVESHNNAIWAALRLRLLLPARRVAWHFPLCALGPHFRLSPIFVPCGRRNLASGWCSRRCCQTLPTHLRWPSMSFDQATNWALLFDRCTVPLRSLYVLQKATVRAVPMRPRLRSKLKLRCGRRL